MILPAPSLLLALSGWLVLGVAASLWPPLRGVWSATAAGIALAAAVELVRLLRTPRITVRRTLPGRMALGVPGEIPLELRHTGRRPSLVRIQDTLPAALESPDFPWQGRVPARGGITVGIRVQPVARGLAEFGQVHVEQFSPWRFWCRRFRTGEPGATRIYPNYEPVVRFAMLSLVNSQQQMGIRQLNRPGQSREFRQLRDYHDGDSLSQIDWKATSRRLSLVSREYEEQRNQTVILLVDCGRRLRAMDGDLTQFDHSLNALLLVSFIALRQGDHVGVMSFGSDTPRWLPPVKGPHAMPAILNHLYDYQSGNHPGDFGEAAEALMARWSRRALVIIATNLRSEEESHFMAPLSLIRRKHLVVVASLREGDIIRQEQEPVTDLDSALRYSAIQHYLDERRQLLAKLHRAGILTVDAPAGQLPVALGNRYIDIRKSGIL